MTAKHKDENEALEYYLSASYKLVSLGLTKKMQKELGLNQALKTQWVCVLNEN